MSSKRPSSKDEVQDDDYGSDDDNEIDRINREKKEILQLSTSTYSYINIVIYLFIHFLT